MPVIPEYLETLIDELSSLPGIGRKKAMKIILELSGKIDEFAQRKKSLPKVDEAEEALVSLGFSRQEAKQAVSEIPKEVHGVNQKIKEALKILGKHQATSFNNERTG